MSCFLVCTRRLCRICVFHFGDRSLPPLQARPRLLIATTLQIPKSTDTQVLGMLLREATGISVTRYMQEVFWNPMGAESNAYWFVDSENMEMVYGFLNATARDYAKPGELFRLKGKVNGKQTVPSSWVKSSTTPDAPHLMPRENPLSDFPMGYGYQWWIPDSSDDFTAIGTYNRFIYVSPENNTVVVKLSANKIYGTSDEASKLSEEETVSFFKSSHRLIYCSKALRYRGW